MKKVLLGVVVLLAISGAIRGLDTDGSGLSEELRAFQNVVVCRDLTLIDFLEGYSEPGTLQWQDELVDRYGWVVGFTAGIPAKDPTHEVFMGMQFNYNESAFKEGVYDFTPVAFEMQNLTLGKGAPMPQNTAMPMLKRICEQYAEETQVSADDPNKVKGDL